MLSFSHDFAFEQNESRSQVMEAALVKVTEERESGGIGYYNLPEGSMPLIEEAREFSRTICDIGPITDIAVIGIGGSSLGIKAVDSLIKMKRKPRRKLHFFENSDPLNISKTVANLTKERTLFIVISKSGGTIETTSIFKTLIAHFDLKLEGEDAGRVIAITDKGSTLSQFADHYGLQQYNIPDNVGGRFSVLSAVGVIPLTVAGYDTEALLNGAKNFRDRFFKREEEHLLQKACYIFEESKKHNINVLFSYANELEDFTKWYVQLWGESLGKVDVEGNRVGMTPIGIIGSIDQHSFLQLLIEGPHDKTVTFIKIDDFENDLTIPDITLPFIEKTDFINGNSFRTLINAQCDATKESLIQSDVPTDMITLSHIREDNIGAMIIYYEMLTSLVGAMLRINTYDQPGVELGKTILYKKFEN